jgi:hypothetical protein
VWHLPNVRLGKLLLTQTDKLLDLTAIAHRYDAFVCWIRLELCRQGDIDNAFSTTWNIYPDINIAESLPNDLKLEEIGNHILVMPIVPSIGTKSYITVQTNSKRWVVSTASRYATIFQWREVYVGIDHFVLHSTITAR